jgi:hypothetical protein
MKSLELCSNFSLRNKCEAASKRANLLLTKIYQQQCLATTTYSTMAWMNGSFKLLFFYSIALVM